MNVQGWLQLGMGSSALAFLLQQTMYLDSRQEPYLLWATGALVLFFILYFVWLWEIFHE